MIILPFRSFVDRPLPYFLLYLLIIVVLCLWPFNFLQTNQVTWEPDGGLKFTPPATAYTSVPPAKLTGLREWTLLLEATTLPPLTQGRIVGYALDDRRYNLIVDQVFTDLVVRLRTGPNQKPRELRVEKLFEPGVGKHFLLAIVYDGNNLSLSVNGEKRVHEKIGIINYSAWEDTCPLVLGSHADGNYCWRGIFYRLAVFPRAGDATRPRDSVYDYPILLWTFNQGHGNTVIDSAADPIPVSWPEIFVPKERTILQSLRDYWPQLRHPYVSDIMANLFLYLPFGYLTSLLIRHRWPDSRGTVPALFIAICLSLTLELLQAYLPTRNSSQMDVLVNGLGAGLGIYARKKEWPGKIMTALHISFRQTDAGGRLSP